MASEELSCKICNLTFTRRFSLNIHLKRMHNEEPTKGTLTKSHILCIICSSSNEIGGFQSYNEYIEHLKNSHSIKIEETIHSFTTIDEFTKWKALDMKDVNYASQSAGGSTSQHLTKSRISYYNCNRSNSKGYKSNCKKNVVKTGGSIKLNGTCPSRIIASFMKDGAVGVRYIQTHVGHEMELRTQQLSKSVQQYLLDQLKAGVTTEKILRNVRNTKNSTLERINLVTKNDLSNLARRHNIKIMRRSNDTTAAAMEIKRKLEKREEDKMWNRLVLIHRPHRNTYHGRIVVQAHKKAVKILESVEENGFGQFRVRSSEDIEYSNVKYNLSCESNCREKFCQTCEICIHKYSCACAEYTKKMITCQHVHAVAMYERKMQQSIVVREENEEIISENRILQDLSHTEMMIKEKSFEIITKKSNITDNINDDEKKKLKIEHYFNFMKQMCNLDNNLFEVFSEKFELFMNNTNQDLNLISTKRKFDEQSYCPDGKKKIN